MPVVVDQKNIAAELGLRTVGEVLAHLQKGNRLITRVLVDGQEPDLQNLSALRQTATDIHTIYIETIAPQEMAGEVLGAVAEAVAEADELARDAGGCLQAGEQNKAFERLSSCFGRWQTAQQSILKISQLMRVDLARVDLQGQTFQQFIVAFTERLCSIRAALESRDFVALADTLAYEMPEMAGKWMAAVASIRATLLPPAGNR